MNSDVKLFIFFDDVLLLEELFFFVLIVFICFDLFKDVLEGIS